MFAQLDSYFKIFSATRIFDYLSEVESTFYIILATGLFLVCPAYFIFKLPGSIVTSVILTILFYLVWLYLISYGKSDFQVFHTTLLSIVVGCVVIYGSFIYFLTIIDIYSNTGVVRNKALSAAWLLLFLGAPTGYFLKHFYIQASNSINKVSMDMQISYDFYNPVYIDQIKYMNSLSKKERIYSNLNGDSASREFITEKAFSKMSLKEKFSNLKAPSHVETALGRDKNRFRHRHLIPLGTDKFIISWYSLLEDKFYEDEFPFPFDDFDIELNYEKEHIRSIEGLVSIHLRPDGFASIYKSSRSALYRVRGQKSVRNFIKIIYKEIDTGQRETYIQNIYELTKFEGSREVLIKEFELIKNSELFKNSTDRITFYDWTTTFESGSLKSPPTPKNISFVTSDYHHVNTTSNINIRSPLPYVISFIDNKLEYAIFIDLDQLINILKPILTPDPVSKGKSQVKFEIRSNKENFKNSQVILHVLDTVHEFNHWEIHLVTDWDN